MMAERAAYSVSEIVERYGISRSTVNRLIRENLIPSSKVLGRRLIDAEGFERAVSAGIVSRSSSRGNVGANGDAPATVGASR